MGRRGERAHGGAGSGGITSALAWLADYRRGWPVLRPGRVLRTAARAGDHQVSRRGAWKASCCGGSALLGRQTCGLSHEPHLRQRPRWLRLAGRSPVIPPLVWLAVTSVPLQQCRYNCLTDPCSGSSTSRTPSQNQRCRVPGPLPVSLRMPYPVRSRRRLAAPGWLIFRWF